LTQEELAKKIKISFVAINRIENGKIKVPTMPTMQKLADLFEMDIKKLTTFEIPDGYIEDETEQKLNIGENNIEYSHMKYDELIDWASKPENRPYIEFIYKWSAKVSEEELQQSIVVKGY
jgi:transcriptional regulator with XRE-family HTH domain